MGALYEVRPCSRQAAESSLDGRVRKYYIAAKEVHGIMDPRGSTGSVGSSSVTQADGEGKCRVVNYLPNAMQQALQTLDLPAEQYFKRSSYRIGGVYWKAKYVEYTDESFREEKQQSEEEKHLGILGPVIKAEVGDTILVTFFNKASWPFSIQPHGVSYGKASEGMWYHDGLSQSGVFCGAVHNFTYRWTVPRHVGPTSSDPPCLTWMYSSAANPVKDSSSGLVGPLLICKSGTLDDNNKQKGIDKEFYLLFNVFDENLSWYLNANIKYYLRMEETSVEKDDGFEESNRMHAINGLMFGNLPGLDVCEGDKVSWHLLGLGSEADVHGAVFQGNTMQMNGMRRDSANLFPHTFATAFMQPDNTGTFEIYCQTSNHYQSGMRQQYNVSKCGRTGAASAVATRECGRSTRGGGAGVGLRPDRSWERERHNHSAESYADVFLSNENGLIGSRYKKAVYREYTDGTFQTPKTRISGEEHLGILGPFLWAEVGDILNIVFKNNASRPYSIHAHGVLEQQTGHPQVANPAINGRLYATLPGLTMYQGERVNWYLAGMGHEVDVHTVHFHAETFIYKNAKATEQMLWICSLGPLKWWRCWLGTLGPGCFTVTCLIIIHAGMEILFTVLPRGESELELGDLTATPGVLLLLAAGVLLGAVIHLERQRRLRRNRRSILDDGFKLMSQKNSGL
ncbi:hypothetical protein DUI87_15215 [Hirundo rustica rustica]|uniref:Plastocyanin-like domain-containing protein n=1 Tax=Hirundo rustica rustica TaxID=333673 RepID=A0A3M0K6M0_HIRRU|nr:hypothetical protein DUI87_15215 [Hirundo rustica rustica]